MEGFREAIGRATFHAAQAREAHKDLTIEPVLRALRAEMVVEKLCLAFHQRLAGGEVDVGLTSIAIPFRNLVFKDHVVAESIPGQL